MKELVRQKKPTMWKEVANVEFEASRKNFRILLIEQRLRIGALLPRRVLQSYGQWTYTEIY